MLLMSSHLGRGCKSSRMEVGQANQIEFTNMWNEQAQKNKYLGNIRSQVESQIHFITRIHGFSSGPTWLPCPFWLGLHS
jgi:hypothetical protein